MSITPPAHHSAHALPPVPCRSSTGPSAPPASWSCVAWVGRRWSRRARTPSHWCLVRNCLWSPSPTPPTYITTDSSGVDVTEAGRWVCCTRPPLRVQPGAAIGDYWGLSGLLGDRGQRHTAVLAVCHYIRAGGKMETFIKNYKYEISGIWVSYYWLSPFWAIHLSDFTYNSKNI